MPELEHSFGGSRFDRYTADFEPDLGGGEPSGPALGGAADPPTPGLMPAAPEPIAAAPAASDATLDQLLATNREIAEIFQEIRGANQPQPQLPVFGAEWGRPAPGPDGLPVQPAAPAATPQAPPALLGAPAAPQSALQQALATFDPFRPESIQAVLQAQRSDLQSEFQQMLQQELGGIRSSVEQWDVMRGEQLARGYLENLKPTLGQFDTDRAVRDASYLTMQGYDEGWALQQAAQQAAAYERDVGMRYVKAYQTYLAERAGTPATPEPTAAPGAAVAGPAAVPSGPGKYAAVVRARLAQDRARLQPATI